MEGAISLMVVMLTLVIAVSGMAASPEVIERAEKEGEVVLYLSLPAEEGKAMPAAFEQRNPSVKTQF